MAEATLYWVVKKAHGGWAVEIGFRTEEEAIDWADHLAAFGDKVAVIECDCYPDYRWQTLKDLRRRWGAELVYRP